MTASRGRSTYSHSPLSVSLLVLTLALLSACSDSSSTSTTQALPTEVEIIVVDQQLDGGEVTVDEVAIVDGGGYVVAYESTNGAPGRRLGASDLLAVGLHDSVVIPLDIDLNQPTETFFMVHREASGDTQLEHPGPDEPFAVDGAIVTAVATIEP